MDRSRLLPSLMLELVQAERSQYRCSMRQAERLDHVPPSAAARAVAAHSNEALDELLRLAKARGLRLSSLGQLGTDALAFVRESLVDRVSSNERAYRSALLGMRRGIDLAAMLRVAAEDEHDTELAAWCERFVTVRERLVRDALGELAWFGHRPRFSLATAPATAT